MRDENRLFFMWGSINFVFMRMVEINLVFVCWSKSIDLSVNMQLDFFFVCVVEINLILLWGVEIDSISV